MKPMEVMIVEDESIVAMDLKDLLEFMGYVVPGVTATGEESILMAENLRPDVVLMDIMLRGEMDGIEAANIIREKLDIPVIYLTASTDDITLERASITGPFGYLIKPFNERELFATIEISRYRHEAEQKSKEIARWLSALLMSMGEAVISIDTNGSITLVNPVAEQLIGLKTDELLHRSIEDVLIFQDKESGDTDSNPAIQALIEHDSHTIKEGCTLVAQDGTLIPVQGIATPVVDKTQGTSGSVLILQDITQRKIAEERILKRSEKLAALNTIATSITQSPGVDEILCSTLEKMMEVSGVTCSGFYLLDTNKESLLLKTHRGLSDEDALRLTCASLDNGHLAKTVESGEPVFLKCVGEITELTRDVPTEIVPEHNQKTGLCIPLKTKRQVLGAVFALTDAKAGFTPTETELLMTVCHQVAAAIENIRLIEEISKAEAQRELDFLRSELLDSVSHEMRTPLTAIKGLASTLCQPDVEWDDESQKEFLEIIEREADVLTRIVNELLEMSQLKTGIMKLEITETKISTVLHQLNSQLAALTKHHELEIQVSPDLPPIYCDEVRIGQVITNLVSNAASYSDEGTTIIIEARQSNDCVEISIVDHGVGIPPENLQKVFERFYRAESGIACRRGGTGLGLSIARSILENHGGKIWVESKPDEGSRFIFSLPCIHDSEFNQEIERALGNPGEIRNSVQEIRS